MSVEVAVSVPGGKGAGDGQPHRCYEPSSDQNDTSDGTLACALKR